MLFISIAEQKMEDKWYTCKFCGKRQEGRSTIVETILVTKVIPQRPVGWHFINLDLWCGSCDPREVKKCSIK